MEAVFVTMIVCAVVGFVYSIVDAVAEYKRNNLL
jgi:hypothetical protein